MKLFYEISEQMFEIHWPTEGWTLHLQNFPASLIEGCLCPTGRPDAAALWSKEWPRAGGGNAARSRCPHSFKNQGNFFPSFWTLTGFSFASLC